MTIKIETERFTLSQLSARNVSRRYLSWLEDPDAQANISAAGTTKTLEDLRRYVIDRSARPDVLFLGIFERATGYHIGNVKYEPVDVLERYAIMGILIGEREYRGIGAAGEVLSASGNWLKEHRNICEIVLGVRRDNHAAIRAYEKVGYRIQRTSRLTSVDRDSATMVWSL